MATRWVHQYGDGLVYSGPCLLQAVSVLPNDAGDQVAVYDGRDATSGKLFGKVKATIILTWALCFVGGVPFDQGIYLDATDGDVETTVVFTPL